MVASYCGLDGSIYPDEILDRAIAQRLAACQVADLDAYWPLLHTEQEGERELGSLYQLLLDPEPAFFKDMHLYRALYERILPELQASDRTPLRFWSAGCGTGAEAYSLAIALTEYETQHGPLQTKIIATDLDEAILAIARRGSYNRRALQKVPDDLRQPYFAPEGKNYRLVSTVAQRVVFMRFNLAEAQRPPALRDMDVILAQRIMSHLDFRARNRLMARLTASLRPGGYLLAAANHAAAGQDVGDLGLVATGHASLFRKDQSTKQRARRTRPSPPSKEPQPPTDTVPPQRSEEPGQKLDPVTDPVSVRGFHKALKAFQRGEYETAWSELQRLPADDPFWPEVYSLRAGVLVQQRRWDEAEVACQQLLAHDPWHADAHLLLGILLQQQGKTEAAIESWRLVVTVQPEQWDAHFRLAESYHDLQAWTTAQREYRYTLNILDSLPVESHKLSLAGLRADQVRQICESSLRRLQWHLRMSAPPEEVGR
jgi:chemotaxis protein methyltransferase CheR